MDSLLKPIQEWESSKEKMTKLGIKYYDMASYIALESVITGKALGHFNSPTQIRYYLIGYEAGLGVNYEH